jgi:hypothetical protein
MRNGLNLIIFGVTFLILFSCGTETTNFENDADSIKNEHENFKDDFPNEYYDLNWSDLSSEEMTWENAIIFCETLGGRLPTISELRALLKNCEDTILSGPCGIKDKCLSTKECWNDACYGCQCDESDPGKYSVFDEGYYLWSSSEQTDNNEEVWTINYYFAYVFSSIKLNTSYVRCIKE